MKKIQYIVNQEIHKAKENFLYQLIGRYGDKLPKEIQDDMRKQAQEICKKKNQLDRKIKL